MEFFATSQKNDEIEGWLAANLEGVYLLEVTVLHSGPYENSVYSINLTFTEKEYETYFLLRFPNPQYWERNLVLIHCTNLIKLPVGLHVRGYLNLYDCRNLTALPRDLRVGGFLNLPKCPKIKTPLPDDLIVGSYIYTGNNLLLQEEFYRIGLGNMIRS